MNRGNCILCLTLTGIWGSVNKTTRKYHLRHILGHTLGHNLDCKTKLYYDYQSL
jgi:hypothetical protein